MLRKQSFFWLGFKSRQGFKGYMATFQLYLWRKASGATPCIISGRTTGFPFMKESKVPGGIRIHSREGQVILSQQL